MSLREETTDLYRDLLNYCKAENPEVPAGVREDRAPTYRRLVRNIIFGNLEKAYPITKNVLTAEQWEEMTTQFFNNWKIPSPELWKMPYSLLEFVCQTNYQQQIDAPFLEDLLLFEWTEIEVFMMTDHDYLPLEPLSSPISDKLQLNLASTLIAIKHPVHKEKGPNYTSSTSPFLVLGYRDPETLSVRFVELTTATAVLVELLRESAKSEEELIKEVAEKLSLSDASEIKRSVPEVINELARYRVILGALQS